MGYNLTVWAIPDIIVGIIILYLAYRVYRANPQKRFNQVFTVSAILWTISWDFAISLMFMANDASTALLWRWISLFFAIPGSLIFVAYVSTFPRQRDFWKQKHLLNLLILLYAPAFWILLIAYPYQFYTNPKPTFYGWTFRADFLAFWAWIISEAVAFYGIARLIQLYMKTPFAIVRRQLLFLIVGVSQVVVWYLFYPILFGKIFPEAVTTGFFFDFSGTIFLALAAYAILKYQLFDIEIKVKKGVEYSILLAVFFGIVLAVQQLLENYVAQILGSVIGIVVGSIIIITSFPLQHMAEDAAKGYLKEHLIPKHTTIGSEWRSTRLH